MCVQHSSFVSVFGTGDEAGFKISVPWWLCIRITGIFGIFKVCNIRVDSVTLD